MRNVTLIFALLLFGVLGISCHREELYDQEKEAHNASLFIYDSFLVGEWKVTSMRTDRYVDLNGDNVLNNNLLNESSCFTNMGFQFRENKTFTVVNSVLGLTLIEEEEEFSCLQNKVFTGNWSLKNDMLYLYININQQVHEQRIHLILTEDSFAFEVNDLQSQEYLKDDGGTSVSGLTIVSLEYSRKAK